MRFDVGPFAGNDAVDTGVAQCASRQRVGVDLVVAQHTVEFGAQPLDGAAAWLVEKMRAEFDGDAVEPLKGMAQQQALGLGVEGRALHTLAVPGRADFDAAVGGVDVHVGGHADRPARGRIDHGKWAHAALGLQLQAPLDLGLHGFGTGNGGEPEVPEFAVAHGFAQVVMVRLLQGLKPHLHALQRQRRCEDAHASSFCFERHNRASCKPPPPPRPTSAMAPMLAPV